MSKWQFDLMTAADAEALLKANDRIAESYGDRIRARRLLDRRFADDGVSAPPLNYDLVRSREEARKRG